MENKNEDFWKFKESVRNKLFDSHLEIHIPVIKLVEKEIDITHEWSVDLATALTVSFFRYDVYDYISKKHHYLLNIVQKILEIDKDLKKLDEIDKESQTISLPSPRRKAFDSFFQEVGKSYLPLNELFGRLIYSSQIKRKRKKDRMVIAFLFSWYVYLRNAVYRKKIDSFSDEYFYIMATEVLHYLGIDQYTCRTFIDGNKYYRITYKWVDKRKILDDKLEIKESEAIKIFKELKRFPTEDSKFDNLNIDISCPHFDMYGNPNVHCCEFMNNPKTKPGDSYCHRKISDYKKKLQKIRNDVVNQTIDWPEFRFIKDEIDYYLSNVWGQNIS